MKKLVFLCALLFAAQTSSGFAASTPETQVFTPQEMEAFMKAATPGKEHQMLQQYVGKWDYTVKWWMKPGMAPEVSKGTAEVQSILAGRFIQQKVTGTSMGKPFEGMGIMGYDNVQKHFSTFWVDSMMTGSMAGSGTLNAETNTIAEAGSHTCPISPTGKRSYRAVWTLPKNNSYKYETFTNDEAGKEFQVMEIIYTKKN